MRLLLATTTAAVVLISTSCSRNGDDEQRTNQSAIAGAGTDDVRIQTASAQLDLALTGDTISAGLAPGALAQARQQTDTGTVAESGLGPSIERLVKSTVQGAVSSRVSFPVSAVKDVRYRNGAIEFDWNERPTRLLDQTKVNGKPFLESFSPKDSERFVRAVRRRIGTQQ